MISALYGRSQTSYYDDFEKICSSAEDSTVPSGCAVIAIEFYGGDNRILTTYAFQPSITPAYTNTIYDAKSMFLLSKYPPTVLIETYYSCVLSTWEAFYQAAGLANSSVQLYLGMST